MLLGVIAIFVDGCLVALRAWSTRWAQTGGGL
jgi:hypothetical protein